MRENQKNVRKKWKGIVVSKSGEKTIVVKIERYVFHKLYLKRIKKSSKFHAHDENNIANVGDLVQIIESRPYSKLKKFRLVKIIKKIKE